MIIEEIIKYNEQFVANKGYEKYLTSKYPDKKKAIYLLHTKQEWHYKGRKRK